MHNLTPREIVGELDRHIIGQDAAKRAVAIAVRNRWRRRQLDAETAREINPKNIIMVGPTGVGKTEIARRLANLTGAPFVKVEASKYTEVGYHGRDVESMIRDLLDVAISMVRAEQAEKVRERAMMEVEDRLVAILMGDEHREKAITDEHIDDDEPARDRHEPTTAAADVEPTTPDGAVATSTTPTAAAKAQPHSTGMDAETYRRIRDRMRQKLRDGLFDDREIEITLNEKPAMPIIGMMGPEQMDPGMANFLEQIVPTRSRRRKVTVARARAILLEEETDKLIDNEKLIEAAIERTENSGIVFLDEIDKIASPADGKHGGPDVSRQGVQRDLLPIVEGSSVATRHGVVKTDGILFIAAGAFHSASISDLMPELQGRFPIRVELQPLTRDDFRRILVEPKAALTVQQRALLETEGLEIHYHDDAIDAMADFAATANERMENIGARRLVTIIEKVFDDISYDAPELAREKKKRRIDITADFVRQRLKDVLQDEDLSRFVL